MAKATKKKGAGGRPTAFKPEFGDALIKHFDIEPFRQELSEESTEYFKDGEIKRESKKYRLVANKLPTLRTFARSIGVAYSTVWRWAEKGEDLDLDAFIAKQIAEGKTDAEAIELAKALREFCNAYKEAKEMQKEFLINGGLGGAMPSPAFIFTAKNVTDMRDKQEQDVNVKGSVVYLPKPQQKDAGVET